MKNINNSFTFGPFSFHFYGLFIGLGILFVYLYSFSNKEKYNLTEKNIDNAFLFSAPLGLFFARIYHLLSSLNYYQIHPSEILKVWNGGLGIFGLIIGVFFGLWVSAKFQKISCTTLLSLVFPPILIAQSLGRLGNFINQEGFGPNNFPTFFLESILCAVAFAIYAVLIKKKETNGFSFYLISYGIIRFITEFFRTDTWRLGIFHVGHLLSLSMIAIGIYFLLAQKRSKML